MSFRSWRWWPGALWGSFRLSTSRSVRAVRVGGEFFGLPIIAAGDTELEAGPGAAVVLEEEGLLKLGLDWESPLRRLGLGVRVALGADAKLVVRGRVDVHGGSVIWAFPGAEVIVGHRTFLANDCLLVSECRVELGSNCAVAWGVTIQDTDFHETWRVGRGSGPRSAPVCIEDGVWIGAGARVLKGVRIGRGAVVAAGSVVTRSVAAGALVAGVPARAVGLVEAWS